MSLTNLRLRFGVFAALLLYPVFGLAQLTPTPVPATRTALLMGVWNYTDETFPALPEKGIQGDLTRMEAKLKELGFDVTVVRNPTLADAKKAVDSFGAVLKTRGGASLFYFTGHGAEHEGKNFLIPAGTNVVVGADLDDEALSANRVLERMEQSGIRVNLVFLDCCRNSLTKSGGDAGLATMSAKGALIGFATRSGEVADTADDGSPYTSALIKYLGVPGVSLPDMHTLVTHELEKSGSTRRPGQYVDLGSIFHLVPVVAPPHMLTQDYALFAGKAAGERRMIEVAAGVTLPFRWCPPGTFTMGSPEREKAILKAAGVAESVYSDEVEHEVTLTRGFWLAETEVTQGQWQAVMGSGLVEQVRRTILDDTLYELGGKRQTWRDWSGVTKETDPASGVGQEDEMIPMYYINHPDAEEWCRRASRHAGQRGWMITLPTEAQWEYACRGGTRGMTYVGDFKILGEMNAPGLDRIAWYGGNSSEGYSGKGWDTVGWKEKQYPGGRAGPRRVGGRIANEWGLQDMLGNVLEWCADVYGPYAVGKVADPGGAPTGAHRVCRGGSWSRFAFYCRAALRFGTEPRIRRNFVGFRPALVPSR